MQEKFKSLVCSVMHNVVSSDKNTILEIKRVNCKKGFWNIEPRDQAKG
jgi:hypothetical protein